MKHDKQLVRSRLLFVISKWNDDGNTMCRWNCAIWWFITFHMVQKIGFYSWWLITLHYNDGIQTGQSLPWGAVVTPVTLSYFARLLTMRKVTLRHFEPISRLHRCWWRILGTKCVGDNFEMFVTDSGCWWPIKYIEKITNMTKKVANIMILPATS